MRIDKIKIDSFRGATIPIEIMFDQRPISIIYGENGSGKSTIVDAIDFVCNRNLGSLTTMSLGARGRDYIHSLDATPSDVKVEMQSSSKVWSARFTGRDIQVTQQDGLPKVSIIRRSEITKLVTSQPNERYEVIQRFVSVPLIDSNEAALKQALDQKERELDDCSLKASQSLETLKKIYQEVTGGPSDALIWAETEASKDVSELEKHNSELKTLISSYDNLVHFMNRLDELNDDVGLKDHQYKDSQEKLDSVVNTTAQDSVELLQVLTYAQDYIEKKGEISTCPVCEQEVVHDVLFRSISDRVAGMSSLKKALENMKLAKEAAKKSELALGQHWKTLQPTANVILKTIRACSLELVCQISTVLGKIVNTDISENLCDDSEHGLRLLLAVLESKAEELRSHNQELTKSININKTIGVNLKAYQDNIEKGKQLEILSKKLREAYEIHGSKRKEAIDDLLASMSKHIDGMYGILHPNEKIGNIVLSLRDNARASLELKADFENRQGIPPHAYYSESHIDTLGLCILFALAKYNMADVVVLDDVLTSVDGQHLTRFIDLLSNIGKDFRQVIVATHYRPWWERYRTGSGDLSNTQFIELGIWTLANGIRTRAFRTETEMLKNELSKDDFDRQLIASKAGVVLECILDFLTLTYRLKVRRNPMHEYTIGEMADSFSSRISDLLILEKPESDSSAEPIKIVPLVKVATAFTWVRNCVGCHKMTIGNETSDNEVLGFGKAVIALAEAMVCNRCYSLPCKKDSGTHWQCRCADSPTIMKPLECL